MLCLLTPAVEAYPLFRPKTRCAFENKARRGLPFPNNVVLLEVPQGREAIPYTAQKYSVLLYFGGGLSDAWIPTVY
jgi:hypothetical protein